MYIGILSSAKFVKDAIVSVDFKKDILHFGVPKSSLILSLQTCRISAGYICKCSIYSIYLKHMSWKIHSNRGD